MVIIKVCKLNISISFFFFPKFDLIKNDCMKQKKSENHRRTIRIRSTVLCPLHVVNILYIHIDYSHAHVDVSRYDTIPNTYTCFISLALFLACLSLSIYPILLLCLAARSQLALLVSLCFPAFTRRNRT